MFKGFQMFLNYWDRRIFLDCFADIFLAAISGGEFGSIVAASYSNVKHDQK